MIYIDSLKHCYYLILVGIMIDYKKQILIIEIKLNV